jgi:clan AA aspartic protease (TIGR02281 family)
MNRILLTAVLVLLSVSLITNVYLWQRLSAHSESDLYYNPANTSLTHKAAANPTNFALCNADLDDSIDANCNQNATQYGSTSSTVTVNTQGPSIKELKAMLEAGQLNRLAVDINNQLKALPLSEPLLLLEAELIERTKPLPTALINYYDLADLPLSPNALKKIQKKIETLYNQAQSQLKKSLQWELVAKLNEPLFQHQPDNRQFTLNLATAYAHQEKMTLMEDVLAALPFNDSDAQAIRDMAYAQQAANADNADNSNYDTDNGNSLNDSADDIQVALERIGNQYRVEAIALNQRASMILDTGASTTAISSRLFARLGKMRNVTFIGIFNVQTASGNVEAQLIQIPKFTFAGYTFTDVSAIVLPEEALPDADGLLGMNILGEFDFSILPQKDILLVNLREKK